jgi:putative OPT family oligopeptide transporter
MTTKNSNVLAPYRELTWEAMVLGIIIGSLMTAAFVYICLKLGFGLGGSTVAAILGFAVLRGAMGKGSIVENNINQTVASGVNAASSGVAFTLPALFLLKDGDPTGVMGIGDIEPLPFILAGMAGSFLGIVMIIPLRKQMLEYERLRFPSGIAVAALLKSPGAGKRQAMLLLGGFLIATLFFCGLKTGLLPEEINLGAALGMPPHIPVVFGITFASLGAGLLSGKGGLPFVAGGVLAWWIISPVVVGSGWVPTLGGLEGEADYIAGKVLQKEMLRSLGIGILIGGAIAGVIASFPALKSAIKGLQQATKLSKEGVSDTADEMSSTVLFTGLSAAVMVLFVAALISTGDMGIGEGAIVAIVGTLWLGLAGLIVAQATGMTDISPLSGMSLIGVTILFFLTNSVTASIVLGVAICIGIGQCGDMMSDLKSGHLIGATPRKQQLAQFLVGWIGVPIAVGAVFLFWESPGFGPGQDLSAPQGDALAAIMKGLSTGDVPLDKYGAGAIIGAGLGLFPISGLGVLVGLAMYLPFYITVTYGIGCLISIYLRKRHGTEWVGTTLVPVAAGFIIGEALPYLVYAIIKATA